MKVQLVVVQGKPEGKVIPLATPQFRIGRNETCHLRPNSDQVSREHAEFRIVENQILVGDLGSRNGTYLNGRRLTEFTPAKDGDLVQVGPLTFQIKVEGAPVAAAAAPAAPVKTADLDALKEDDIESWLVSDDRSPTVDTKSGVYRGETITFSSYAEVEAAVVSKAAPEPEPAAQAAPEPEAEEEPEPDTDSEEEAETEPASEEWVDESNPFHVKKKAEAAKAATGPAKPEFADTSSAADALLRQLLERRRANR